MDRYEFDMTTFVTSTEGQDVALSPQTQNEVTAMQEHYPELSPWSRFAFFVAWGAYSQDIYAVSWVDWLTKQRDEGFLAYCYVSQRWPCFSFGGTGLYDDEVQALGETHPWEQHPLLAAPTWVCAEQKV